MKKFSNFFSLFLLFTVLTVSSGYGQKKLILQPDASTGKDARIHNNKSQYTSGASDEFIANAWTWGSSGLMRSLIDFDLSSLPLNAVITNAVLYLYAYPDAASEGHSMHSGSNECILQRITSSWNDNTLTWATQPTVTTQNQVTISETNNPNKDYEIDVTQLIKDMINNPTESFGMMLKLKNESHYRRMTFASSNHTNPAKRPKLEITYLDGIEYDSCFVFQPNAQTGKDARIHNNKSQYTSGASPEFIANAWTWSGTGGIMRSLLDFDLYSLPPFAIIEKAELFLYAYPDGASEGHSMHSGSNECVLQRITSSWDDNTITWATQPTVTTQNQITIPETNNPNKDFELDVTELIKDIADNPTESFGMMLKLKNESYYRRMTFASSNHTNPAKHPKLVICVSFPDSLYRISGRVYYGDSIMKDGSILLLDANKDSTQTALAAISIVNDSFTFSFIPYGKYKIMAVPPSYFSNKFHSTYYVKTTDWNTAYSFTLDADIGGVDIQLVGKTSAIQNLNIPAASIKLFPNPAQKTINLEFYAFEQEVIEIQVFDLIGKNVQTSLIKTDIGFNHFDIDVSLLQNGIYFLTVKGSEIFYKRFVKSE